MLRSTRQEMSLTPSRLSLELVKLAEAKFEAEICEFKCSDIREIDAGTPKPFWSSSLPHEKLNELLTRNLGLLP